MSDPSLSLGHSDGDAMFSLFDRLAHLVARRAPPQSSDTVDFLLALLWEMVTRLPLPLFVNPLTVSIITTLGPHLGSSLPGTMLLGRLVGVLHPDRPPG